MTVNKERVQMLVDALESGDYQQARGKLCRVSGDKQTYCCLGVAVEVARANGLDVNVTEEVAGGYRKYNGESAYLPDSVPGWYGFESIDLYVEVLDDDSGESMTVTATSANDKYNKSFAEIAAGFRRVYLRGEASDGQS